MRDNVHAICCSCVAKDAQIAQLESDLGIARQQAVHYEQECHSLRRQIQALRMEKDTERIQKADDHG